MEQQISQWLQIYNYQPYPWNIQLLNCNGIRHTHDCGRCSFGQLTKIFDLLIHPNITEKVRLERDLTALHMKYRSYYKQQTNIPIEQVCKESITPIIATQTESKPVINETNQQIVTIKPIKELNKKVTNSNSTVTLKLDKNPNTTTLRFVVNKPSKLKENQMQIRLKNAIQNKENLQTNRSENNVIKMKNTNHYIRSRNWKKK
eukprot:330327_1